MKALNYTELRTHLKASLDFVVDNEDFVVIHRKQGKSVVMISLDEYNSIQETAYLLKSKANAEHLRKGIEDLSKGNVKSVDSKDLF